MAMRNSSAERDRSMTLMKVAMLIALLGRFRVVSSFAGPRRKSPFLPACSRMYATPPSGSSCTEEVAHHESSPLIVEEPLLRSEGLLAVVKPLEWTSQDVVAYVRRILESDARKRGLKPARVGARGRNKSRIVKVGHGGTLDPLATGLLVLGVGKGTKQLQNYLTGSKQYVATAELGFETTTLDMEGNVTKKESFDHVSLDTIEKVLPNFTGTIQQVPPIFSAIRKGGKKLYQAAREGKTPDDLKIEPREVEVHRIKILHSENLSLPHFGMEIECGKGTYIRSLIRDIGHKIDTVATMTGLERTKQGQFTLETALVKEEWTADNIYAAIDAFNVD